MNERIRELAEQAGAYVNEVYTPPVRSKTPGKIWEDGHIEWHEQFHKKFAELIVRECAERLLNDTKLTDIQTTRCVASIKEYFGVKDIE